MLFAPPRYTNCTNDLSAYAAARRQARNFLSRRAVSTKFPFTAAENGDEASGVKQGVRLFPRRTSTKQIPQTTMKKGRKDLSCLPPSPRPLTSLATYQRWRKMHKASKKVADGQLKLAKVATLPTVDNDAMAKSNATHGGRVSRRKDKKRRSRYLKAMQAAKKQRRNKKSVLAPIVFSEEEKQEEEEEEQQQQQAYANLVRIGSANRSPIPTTMTVEQQRSSSKTRRSRCWPRSSSLKKKKRRRSRKPHSIW